MIGALEKLANAAPSSFHVLEPAKAKRLGGATMVIPSPQDVANAVALIPPGETRTILDLRRQLAADAGAEIACPAATIKHWKWVAWASQEPLAPADIQACPWWRILKDGKLSPHLPGGLDHHRQLLDLELN